MFSAQAPHEAVHKFEHQETHVRGIVAIHSTALGPAAGGCRMWHYDSEERAIEDALRLSAGMTFKNALAGLPFGGGKAVLMLKPGQVLSLEERQSLFRAFGDFIEDLGGIYVTAEDVGCTPNDMAEIAKRTSYVAGLPRREDAAGGDPSPWTGLGVFLSMQAAAKHVYKAELSDLVVGIQGLGHVGMDLCTRLNEAGAKLLISDIDSAKCARAATLFGADVVACNQIVGHAMDVFAPCALGGILTEQSVALLKARLICGAANNQLATSAQGRQLAKRKIVYAPDYLVNAGGIINVSAEYLGESVGSVEQRILQIPDRLLRLIGDSEASGEPMNILADAAAGKVIAQAYRSKVA
ncbi:Glu/Leu/Phe/Val family dehydrogenase [Parasphingorhabdus sp.]|uniref:Glu/Leu/Phe/Val family dehydrogenase n=1 Tax=Parasphingorhabdus sp. TaxID=2709688 RepID=UPI003A8CD7D6